MKKISMCMHAYVYIYENVHCMWVYALMYPCVYVLVCMYVWRNVCVRNWFLKPILSTSNNHDSEIYYHWKFHIKNTFCNFFMGNSDVGYYFQQQVHEESTFPCQALLLQAYITFWLWCTSYFILFFNPTISTLRI